MLRFRKKREGGNEMTPIDAEAVQLVLVDSMLPKNTGRMIEKVKRLQGVLPESVECLFDGIEGLVSSVTREGRLDGGRLREAVEMNQCLLQALGVSCEAIDEIVRVSRHKSASEGRAWRWKSCNRFANKHNTQRLLRGTLHSLDCPLQVLRSLHHLLVSTPHAHAPHPQ